jgi:glycogen operon protein
MLLSGDAMACTDANGEVMTDDTFLMLFQGEDKALTVRLPDAVWGKSWRVRIDTHRPFAGGEELFQAAETVPLPPRSLMVLERVQPTSGSWRPPPLPYGDLA